MRNRAQRRASGITFRALVIGLILIVVNAYWLTVTSELVAPLCLLTFVSLFFNAVFSLFVLVLCNQLLVKLTPERALSTQELLVVYIMVVMVSTIGGHTLMCLLVGTLAHPIHFATPENEWADMFWRYIPDWFIPSTDALDDYFEGESTLYTMEHIRGWLTPVIVWTAFISVIWFVMICINSIIRRQWTEEEKLAYPIIQLPLRMTAESSSFFRNKGMWLGFALAGSLEILAGLNYLFPRVPGFRLNYYPITHLFTGRPWNTIGWIAASAFPFIIGITFFVPLDISLSAWVFYLVGRVERVIRLGVLSTGNPYFDERAAGAWVAVGILALWSTRRHFRRVFRKILFSGSSDLDDSEEPMKYRTAVFGIIIGLGFLIVFSYKAGMAFWVVGGFIFLYFVMGIGIARVRAEFGPPSHEVLWVDPARVLAVGFGPRSVGASSLTILSFYHWLNRLNIAHPMPNQLEAFKLAERTKINSKRLVWIMMLATVMGTLACFWAYLHVLYKVGAPATSGFVVGMGWETFNRLQTWLNNPTGPVHGAINSMGIASAITFLLYFLRHRFFWWPFHPIGYVMTSATWGGLSDYWFSVFLGWMIKAIIVKFFGLKAHRRAVPFFLGLILGDYLITCLWSLVAIIFHTPVYILWP